MKSNLKFLFLTVVVFFAGLECSVVAQDDIPKQGFGTANPPNGSEPEDLVMFAERKTLEDNEKLILRTINFMVSETSIDQYLESMGELMPEQAKSLNREHDAFQKKAKEIRSRTDSILEAYEKQHGRAPRSNEVEAIVGREIKKAEFEFYSSVSNELLRHQKLAIANWRPASIGVSKTLTETPIGKTIGLSDIQIEKIRDRSNEIGEEFQKAFVKARSELLELYEDVLTEEQAKKIKELYYPNAASEMPFALMSPAEMITKLPYKQQKEEKR